MGSHDLYGKLVLKEAAGDSYIDCGAPVMVPYGSRGGATIDGVVGDRIAVEIESRVSKQVRGALLDLICHPYKKKLLVLLPVHMSNPTLCAKQCEHILSRFVAANDFRVLVLKGSGHGEDLRNDARAVQVALGELGERVAV